LAHGTKTLDEFYDRLFERVGGKEQFTAAYEKRAEEEYAAWLSERTSSLQAIICGETTYRRFNCVSVSLREKRACRHAHNFFRWETKT
jgi:hypothetical protein